MILVDNLHLIDVTHTCMYIQTYIHTTYTRTTNTLYCSVGIVYYEIIISFVVRTPISGLYGCAI